MFARGKPLADSILGKKRTKYTGYFWTSRAGINTILTNKTPISKSVIDACPSIKYIGVLATGYNVVDIAATKEKGICVTNIPTYGTAAVGQFAIALLLEICHHVGEHNESVHRGEWQHNPDWCYWNSPLIDLADALRSGKVYAAGLDVVSTEPIKADNPLLKAPNCIITPHISWAPKESRMRLYNLAVDNLQAFISGHPENQV